MKEKPKTSPINSLQRLPHHILEIIFSKLPVVYLPSCRLVCKEWNDVLLGCAASSLIFTPSPSFVCAATGQNIHSIDFQGNDEFVASLDGPRWGSMKILGSCNGLLCFSRQLLDDFRNTYVGILNLMTNEDVQFPHTSMFYCYGLGFCPTTKRYKLARAPPCSNIVEIFTLGSGNNHNQWRSCCIHDDHSTSKTMIRSNGVYFDGALYWAGEDITINSNVICRLDVEQEKLEPIYLPQYSVGTYYSNLAIGVFSGNLYASFSEIPRFNFQVWIMDKHCSWIKNFSVVDFVPRNWDPRPKWRQNRLQLIKVCEDGEILCVVYGLYFFMYNPKTQKVRIMNNKNKEYSRKGSWVYEIEPFSFDPLQRILSGD